LQVEEKVNREHRRTPNLPIRDQEALQGRHELDHIAQYLAEKYEFDGGWLEAADRLRPLVREALIDELLEEPRDEQRRNSECD
jgi:hypothetical protein